MQKGGSQYGVPPPEMPPFGAGSSRPQMVGSLSSTQLQPSDTTSPRPPAASRKSNFEELDATVTSNYPEDDPFGVGEEVERGVSGNRWPRQETLALLKIRSDMDAMFRDATLKGPLWEEVSRKLAEQGYTRSAKKCKEKFENVHKYYKRTKDSRAARPDGKSYRFFSQLEALNSASSSPTAIAATNTNTPAIIANPASTFSMSTATSVPQPTPISSKLPVPPSMAALPVAPTDTTATAAVAGLSALGGGMSFSTNTTESESETEDEETEEGLENQHKRKREPGGWEGGGRGGNRKMMVFFEGLMKQVIERQEAMQQKFLETIEKREQDRMIREEAWRWQEMARLSHEHEAMAQERAVAASRDATIISFLQKITGQTIQLPQPVSATPPQPLHVVSTATAPPPQQAPPPHKQASTPPAQPQQPTPQQSQSQPQQQHQPQPQPPQSLGQPQQQLQAVPPAQERQQPPLENAPLTKPAAVETAPTAQEQHNVQDSETNLASASDPMSSRWPKAEVHALINIRAGMELKYQEAGPKGPLWEEISAAMKHMGYNRNAKRCKEKWENINKYFKKVKESNKKRPDDAKTCPYFHQLDALYHSKILGGSGGGGESSTVSGRMQQQPQDPDPTVLPITTLPPPSNGGDGANTNGGGTPKGASQTPSSNGGLLTGSFIQQEVSTDLMKKPEDIVKELMEQRRQRSYPQFDFDRMEENTDDEEDKEDDDGMDEEEQKMAYKIEFQRPSVPSNATSTSNGSKTSRAAASTGSFLAMVHQ